MVYCEDGSVERGYRGVLGERDVSAGVTARTEVLIYAVSEWAERIMALDLYMMPLSG